MTNDILVVRPQQREKTMSNYKGRTAKDTSLRSYVSTALSKSDRALLEELVIELDSDRSAVLREAFQLYVASRHKVAA